jgi:hypothetical protein
MILVILNILNERRGKEKTISSPSGTSTYA